MDQYFISYFPSMKFFKCQRTDLISVTGDMQEDWDDFLFGLGSDRCAHITKDIVSRNNRVYFLTDAENAVQATILFYNAIMKGEQ